MLPVSRTRAQCNQLKELQTENISKNCVSSDFVDSVRIETTRFNVRPLCSSRLATQSRFLFLKRARICDKLDLSIHPIDGVFATKSNFDR